MSATDHDLCLYIIHKYMTSQPNVFSLLETPSYGLSKSHGPDLVAENRCMNVLEYVEVELDASASEKFKRISEKATKLYKKFKKPIRIWLVSSSAKWVKGVEEQIKTSHRTVMSNILVERISPIDVGERKFPF